MHYYSPMRLVLILPALGEWKAESTYRHCSNGVQPVPKAVYRSFFAKKNGKQCIVRKGRIVVKILSMYIRRLW